MSACRMCDRCATIFSERAEGWSTYSGSIRRKNQQTGRDEMVSQELDLCPECTELQSAGPTRPELATTVSPRYEPGATDPRD